jgi:Toprim domain
MPDAAVMGVQLTRLLPDGADRERGDDAKITIGHCLGAPIIVAPPTDLLALTIAEGIEDALSAHLVTGAGAWAAGGAGRMAALAEAVPTYIDCVTILIDGNEDGRRGAMALVDRLHARGFDGEGQVRLCEVCP